MLKKKWMIAGIIVLIIVIAIAFYFSNKDAVDSNGENLNNNQTDTKLYCNSDLDCVPAGCCHPNSCVNVDYAPSCSGIICSLVCQPESLDCGQGSCNCISNRCR